MIPHGNKKESIIYGKIFFSGNDTFLARFDEYNRHKKTEAI